MKFLCIKIEQDRPLPEVLEGRRKMEAALLLLDIRKDRITVPTRDEWIGLNLLERDDELKRT